MIKETSYNSASTAIGREHQFIRLMNEHRSEIRKILKRNINHIRDTAEYKDYEQEIWLNAWKYFDSAWNNFGAWLWHVAKSAVFKYRCKHFILKKKDTARVNPGEYVSRGTQYIADFWFLSETFKEDFRDQDISNSLRTAIQNIPGEDRLILELWLQGYLCKEIGMHLGKSKGMIEKSLARSREFLRNNQHRYFPGIQALKKKDNPVLSKPVEALDSSGNVVFSFLTLTETQKSGFTWALVKKAIAEKSVYRDLYWRYKEKTRIVYLQLDAQGKLIREWSTWDELKSAGYSPDQIKRVFRGEVKMHKDFMWQRFAS